MALAWYLLALGIAVLAFIGGWVVAVALVGWLM